MHSKSKHPKIERESNEEFMDRQIAGYGRLRVRFSIEMRDESSPYIWKRFNGVPMHLEFHSIQGALKRIDALKAWFRSLAPGWTAPREEPGAMPRIRFTPPPGFSKPESESKC